MKKTQVLDETYHPVWNETLTFFINPEDPCEVQLLMSPSNVHGVAIVMFLGE